MRKPIAFTLNGERVEAQVAPHETLVEVLREEFGLYGARESCGQGLCGCCTVLVDGDARVACVTPAVRVDSRAVTTVEGLDSATRDSLAGSFVGTGGSQCGFCTPGIVMRAASLLAKGRTRRADVDRGLAAHLCRCTGWQTVYEAIDAAASEVVDAAASEVVDAAASRRVAAPRTDLDATARRA